MTVETTFAAMGTTAWARTADEESAAAVMRWFTAVESAASRFDASSELTAVNRSDSDIVPLGPVLADLFRTADEMRRATGGLVDPAVGVSIVDWGYDVSFETIIPPESAPRPTPAAVWQVSGSAIERVPGVLMDLGGIAKGWTCDRAVETGLASVASAGGDLRSADQRLVVDVLHPFGGTAASLHVGVGALATSSTARRRWQVGGLDAHHIIDPRTGEPARSPVVSASVMARTSAEAEAGAKAVLLHGADGLAWAADQSWLGGAVVCWADGSVYGTGDLEVAA